MSPPSALFAPQPWESVLPLPLMFPLHAARREFEAGHYSQAVSHLVDVGGAFVEVHTALALSCLAREPTRITNDLRATLEHFLAEPPSIGTWLSLWERVARALDDGTDGDPFLHLARIAAPASRGRPATLPELASLTNFRNSVRHRYTLPDDRALDVLGLRWPLLVEVLRQAGPALAGVSLLAIESVAHPYVEARKLTGVCDARDAELVMCESSTPARVGSLVFARTDVVVRGGVAELLDVGHLLSWQEREVHVFNRCRGRDGAIFVSASSNESEERAATLKERLGALLPPDAHAARRKASPNWAKLLRNHRLVSRALTEESESVPEDFYRGNPVSWPDLARNLDVRRELSQAGAVVSPEQFDEEVLPRFLARVEHHDCPLMLFRGPAGAGKTTVLRRTALEFERRFHGRVVVLHLEYATQLDTADLLLARSENLQQSIILVLDEAGEFASELERFRNMTRANRYRVGILCAERPNLWPSSSTCEAFDVPSALSRNEARHLLDRLRQHELLGCLAGMGEDEQLQLLAERYDRQLIVTLREATTGVRFDEIIRSEHDRIPDDDAREVYLAAALCHQARLPLPVATAQDLCGRTDWKSMKKDILRKTEGALVKDGREDEPFLRTRHAAIAEVLCGTLEAVVVGSAFGALAQALGRTDQHEILRRLLTAPQSRRPWENTEDVAAIADAIFEAPKGQRLAQTLLPQLSSGPQAERLTSRLLVRHLADGDFDAGAPLSRLLDMAARVGQPSRVLCDALGGLGTRSEATDRLVDAAAAALIEEGEFAGARELIDAEIRRAEVEGRRDLSLRATRLVSELDAQSLNGPHPELENLRVGVEAGLWVSRSAALALVRHLECRQAFELAARTAEILLDVPDATSDLALLAQLRFTAARCHRLGGSPADALALVEHDPPCALDGRTSVHIEWLAERAFCLVACGESEKAAKSLADPMALATTGTPHSAHVRLAQAALAAAFGGGGHAAATAEFARQVRWSIPVGRGPVSALLDELRIAGRRPEAVALATDVAPIAPPALGLAILRASAVGIPDGALPAAWTDAVRDCVNRLLSSTAADSAIGQVASFAAVHPEIADHLSRLAGGASGDDVCGAASYQLARWRQSLGEAEEADQLMRVAAELAPVHSVARDSATAHLVSIELASGHVDAARARANEYLELAARSDAAASRTRHVLARDLLRHGEIEQAVATLTPPSNCLASLSTTRAAALVLLERGLVHRARSLAGHRDSDRYGTWRLVRALVAWVDGDGERAARLATQAVDRWLDARLGRVRRRLAPHAQLLVHAVFLDLPRMADAARALGEAAILRTGRRDAAELIDVARQDAARHPFLADSDEDLPDPE